LEYQPRRSRDWCAAGSLATTDRLASALTDESYARRNRMIALTIDDPAVITRILTHLGLSTEPGEPAPGRAPPLDGDASTSQASDIESDGCANRGRTLSREPRRSR
jgi:hypothetical protein